MSKLFFSKKSDIGKSHVGVDKSAPKKFWRGDKVDEIGSINDIAKATREFVKKIFPKTKWSITVDKFAGGQALRVYLLSAPFNPIKNEEPWGEADGGGKYLTVNTNSFETSDTYTDEVKKVLKAVRDFYSQYNYDNSDPMTDYYNVRFYETLGIGKWDKGFVQTEASKPSKPKPSGTESGGNTTPKFPVGSRVNYETSKGTYGGVVEYSKFVKDRETYIYGVKSSNDKVYTIWESKLSLISEAPPVPENELPFKVDDVFRRNLITDTPPDTKIIYTILLIGEEKTQYRIDYLDKGTNRLSTKANSKITEEITEGWWIPYEGSIDTKEPPEDDAVKELDLELEAINDLRKLDLFDFQLQNETRSEINDLLNTREVFMESENFNLSNLINDYFQRITEPVNIDLTDKNIVLEITKTKAFKDWFGDWQNESFPSSKVINFTPEEGAFVPQIVYHGTWAQAHFSRFKTNKFPIIYFATNRTYSEWFANLGQGIIYECFLNIRFPFDFRPLGLLDVSWGELTEFFKMNYGLDLPKSNVTTKQKVWAWIRMDGQNDMKLINTIKDAGFDGMIHIENNPQQVDAFGNEETTTAYMIFNSDQAKLIKYAGSTTGFSDIMFMEKGGKLGDDLLAEIKKLGK
jgi:hypothetical protein